MMENKWYVYRHIRLDKNEPFYIGIGCKKNYLRAYQINPSSRNNIWNKIFNKTKIEIEIIFENLNKKQASEKEKEFIKLYGRKDLGSGILCNMTDGGEGISNYVMSEDVKLKISEGNKGKPKPKPDNFSQKMSEIVKGSVRTQESKLKQSITTKKTLSKIKIKLSEKSKGIKNSNSVQYSLLNKITNEIVIINGYKSVLIYYNETFNRDKKDAMFLIKKIKENKIPELEMISTIKINKINPQY